MTGQNRSKVKTKDAEGKEVVTEETQPNDDTQMLAEDYLRMGIVKAQKMNQVDPYLDRKCRKDYSCHRRRHYRTDLLRLRPLRQAMRLRSSKRHAQLGGYAAKQRKQIPTKAPYTDAGTEHHSE